MSNWIYVLLVVYAVFATVRWQYWYRQTEKMEQAYLDMLKQALPNLDVRYE